MKKPDALKLSNELMKISNACFLTTIDKDGFPQTRAMLNLRNSSQYPNLVNLFKQHESDFLVYFTTNMSSSKIAQIKNNPAVSVYYCKPREWRGLMLGGSIEIVTDKNTKVSVWQENWTMYYPKGPTDPNYAILQLKPKTVKYYHQLDGFTFNL